MITLTKQALKPDIKRILDEDEDILTRNLISFRESLVYEGDFIHYRLERSMDGFITLIAWGEKAMKKAGWDTTPGCLYVGSMLGFVRFAKRSIMMDTVMYANHTLYGNRTSPADLDQVGALLSFFQEAEECWNAGKEGESQ